jgi:hypothetical protein
MSLPALMSCLTMQSIGPAPTAIILNRTDRHLRRNPPIPRRQISERNVGFRVGDIRALIHNVGGMVAQQRARSNDEFLLNLERRTKALEDRAHREDETFKEFSAISEIMRKARYEGRQD